MTSRRNSKDDAEGQLLFLPQSDLKRSTRPNLVLMALPSSSASRLQQAFQEGDCKLVTNSKSSALVLPETSYDLTTIGTSNTLVVYPKTTSIEEAASPNNPMKRIKLDNNKNRQACRLIQPGGSGSSFLSLQPKKSLTDPIRSLLQDETTKYKESDLALELQCSLVEIENALETLPCITVDVGHVQLLTEEQLWQAKRSMVETLCEEPDAEDEQVPPEEFHDLVEKRIAPPNDEDGASDNWASAVASKIVILACAPTSASSSSRRHFDKHKIALWALQELVLTSRRSTWPLDELLSTWQTRLPLKWCGNDNNGSGEETNNVASRSVLEQMSGVQITTKDGTGNKKDAVDVVIIEF
jgi:hypothetical protein